MIAEQSVFGTNAIPIHPLSTAALFIVLAWYLIICLPWRFWRKKLSPLVEKMVQEQSASVVALQENARTPFFDVFHRVVSATVGVEFYASFLPFLLWCGWASLGRQCTVLMAVAVTLGNACKDALQLPRPPSPPVWRKKTKAHTQEWGLPSTHTANTVCLVLYVMIWALRFDGLSNTLILWSIVGIAWCILVSYGRLYLGMHSPVDIFAGFVLGVGLALLWSICDGLVDWLLIQMSNAALTQLGAATAILAIYPPSSTPSYKYAVYFTGVIWGGFIGVRRTLYVFHNPELQSVIQKNFLPLSTGGVFWALRRFSFGLLVVAIVTAIIEQLLTIALPLVFRVLHIPHHLDGKLPGSDAQDRKPQPTVQSSSSIWPVNVHTIRRFFTYAALCWTVTEGSMILFEILDW